MSVATQYDTCTKCGSLATQGRALQRCSRCKLAIYCSGGCQKMSWKSHKRVCKEPPLDLILSPPASDIAGVRLLGGFNRPFYPRATTAAPGHPIWTTGAISPLSQIAGVPLLIHREQAEHPLTAPNIAEKDNQAVTYMMIDPESGYASARWQKNIGPVIVVRADHKPLTLIALEMIWMFCDRIIDHFGDNPSPPLDLYSREAFDQFCREYQEEYVTNNIRAVEIGAQVLPL